MLSSVAFNYID